MRIAFNGKIKASILQKPQRRDKRILFEAISPMPEVYKCRKTPARKHNSSLVVSKKEERKTKRRGGKTQDEKVLGDVVRFLSCAAACSAEERNQKLLEQPRMARQSARSVLQLPAPRPF